MKCSEKLDKIELLTKVTEDIYKLSVHFPFGMRQVNSFLFKGENGYTVIDTGSQAKESIEIWEQVLSSGITIEKIVFTHTHPDHIGLAGWFQKNHHVPVFVSKLGYEEIQHVRKNESGKWMSSIIYQHGGPEISPELLIVEQEAYDFEPDGIFESQLEIELGYDRYETIWTPGHAWDHFCFYNKERHLMVTGDLVLNEISPIIAFFTQDDINPLKSYFESLDLVSSYSTTLALPGHGELITNLTKRIEDIKEGHMHRMQQMLNSIKSEKKTANQLYQEIYGDLNYYKFFAPFMMTITRIVYLESIGKVHREVKDDKLYYCASDE